MRASGKSQLARIRTERGMTQKELAKASGVGLSTIQLWETEGTKAASVKNLAKTAQALGCQIGEIID